MNYKALVLGATIGLLAAVVPSCGKATTCSASNCKGCCDASGTCQGTPANGNNTTCGTAGNACQDCTKQATNKFCNNSFVCAATGGMGGGAGGGSSGGGGGSSGTCTAASCATGCCAGNQCIPTSAQTATNCGHTGAACAPCGTGMLCTTMGATAGTCTTSSGGGDIGAACTSVAGCANVVSGPQTGQDAECKTQSFNGAGPSLPYPGGYCTHRCYADAHCGGNSICVYGLGNIGEIENFCLAGCSQDTDCRTGYQCVNFGDQTTPSLGCWLVTADGGFPDEVDAGTPGGAGTKVDAPCTDDSMCTPPQTGQCIIGTDDAGMPTGFPGGDCLADCTVSVSNAWCGADSVCVLFLDDIFQDGLGDGVVGFCQGACDTADAGHCRSGYYCNPLGSGATGPGYCDVMCENPGFTCPNGSTCNHTSHTCM